MTQVILTDEQARIVASALQPIEFLDSQGTVVRTIQPIWTEEDLADAERRLASDEPRHTTAQVMEFLRRLESP